MARQTIWSDDFWLLLLQLYMRKPTGVKPMYSRAVVDLSLELHIRPAELFAKMCVLANPDTPRIGRLWQQYGNNPHRLARAVRLLRSMNGFNTSGGFYEGVGVNETFERMFAPVSAGNPFMPVMLILILDLYFRLTPATMVPETPEVVELSRLMKVQPAQTVGVMSVFRMCDAYLRRTTLPSSLPPCCADEALQQACRKVWERYGNSDTEALASFAGELKEYFRR
ncbi:MAG: hypothetical protein ACI4TW_03595 [Prevotella sp.]